MTRGVEREGGKEERRRTMQRDERRVGTKRINNKERR